MATKHDYSPASNGRDRLRRWAKASYDMNTGRANSSLNSDQFKHDSPSPHGNACARPSAQIPSGFEGRDRRATQGGPVKDRPLTIKHEG
jgi:hypothetical protein